MSDWLDWLLAHAGEPIPCEICRTPTAPKDLTETTVPGAVTTFGFTVDRVIWVCKVCPLPGGRYNAATIEGRIGG